MWQERPVPVSNAFDDVIVLDNWERVSDVTELGDDNYV